MPFGDSSLLPFNICGLCNSGIDQYLISFIRQLSREAILCVKNGDRYSKRNRGIGLALPYGIAQLVGHHPKERVGVGAVTGSIPGQVRGLGCGFDPGSR